MPSEGASFTERRSILPFLVPPASCMGMLLLFLPVRLFLAHDAWAFLWGLIIAVAYGLIVAASWVASRTAGLLTRWIVRGGFAAGAVWSYGMSAYPGSLSWRAYVVYAIGSIVITIASWLLAGLRDGDPRYGRYTMVEGVQKALGTVRAINAIKAAEGRVEARIETKPGYALADLDQKALAATWGVPVGGVQVQADDTSSTRGRIIVDPSSIKAEAVPWPGPSRRPQRPGDWGSLVTDPIVVGPDTAFHLAGDPKKHRNMSHVLAAGMSGAGKSTFIQYVVLEGMTRKGFAYDYADPRKGNQAPAWLREGARRVATNKEDVARLLAYLRDEELPMREKAMGAAGHSEWTEATFTELGIPFLLVVLDELAGVAQDLPRMLTDLGETARSLGVLLLAGFQRIQGDRIPVAFREQFGSTFIFGLKDRNATEHTITEAMDEAGAQPELWGNKMPGMHYAEFPGDDDEPGRKRRVFAPRDLMAKWGSFLVSARRDDAGAPFNEIARLEPARGSEVEPSGAETDTGTVEEFDEIGDDDISDLDEGDDVIDEDDFGAAETFERLDAMADQMEADGDFAADDPEVDRLVPRVPDDMRAELAEVDDDGDEFSTEGVSREVLVPRKLPEDQARKLLQVHVAAFASRGVQRFKADDELMDPVYEATGFTGSWLRKHLDRMAAEGTLITKAGPRLGYDVVGAHALERGRR